ncbi:carbamoylphosphate synthase large subunit [Paenibacillus phyllosphaerae]|uniref:Carbamoylphosphate synthase large subunit n=1 Tax=Paenibacillus phyllosphaerae TaxID=274593 RepID=A0A7W5FLY7_9BACL|nr:ATP-grasp domain-containing protein [Paenibacillus phyllosphaerae]MBB3109750.1 carbamoylphosphate synthase large subunit [Paenibacillus phyllosphaerae]
MAKKVRVWFNRWFSVAYLYMNHIRNNPDGVEFEFYGTHPDRNSMALQNCDYAEVEPVLEGLEYVEYCVDFCRRHQIDVFIPRLKMLDIARHIHLFDEVGTKVTVCRDIELLESMIDKDKFYELVRESDVMVVPEYRVVNTAEQFKAAYEELASLGHRVCFKPTNSEGGQGFRIINNDRDQVMDLFGTINPYVTFDRVYDILSGVDQFPNMMVMELLEGSEYSIDCLADPNGKLIAAVPRRKGNGRMRYLEDNQELIEIAHKVAEAYRIPFNYNIQMRYKNGVPKLLEINPRMSGGLHVSCLNGTNYPYLAVKLALGGHVEPLETKLGITASHIEQPMIMKDVIQAETVR